MSIIGGILCDQDQLAYASITQTPRFINDYVYRARDGCPLDKRNGTERTRATTTIRSMHEKGRGILGMKIMGNGEFTDDADREKSVQFAMSCGFVDAIVVGLKSVEELDTVIARLNRALAASQT